MEQAKTSTAETGGTVPKFMLDPNHPNEEIARASRMAMRTFAQTIKHSDDLLFSEGLY